MQVKPIHIIGAGLAGSEAAWQIANAGVPVVLHEMRPIKKTDAHQTENCAELVCSNSFRSDDHEMNAVGLIHHEMRQLNSLIMACGDEHAVPAGSALAVDREGFSQAVTQKLQDHRLITIERGEVAGLPPEEWGNVIIATGPLTSDPMAQAIREVTGQDQLAFFDAIAPIVHRESINFDIAWFQSRYDKGDTADYINCPMNKEQYIAFIEALIASDKTEFKDWEKDTPYFDGCMPIEVMAERGIDTPRFGPMKPIGLKNPHVPEGEGACYAVVQLRQDNKLGTLWNIVGFQTKMKYGAQADVLRMIPGLEKAEFARMGGIHRNTFIKSPVLLDERLRLKTQTRLRFAGQMTGCEGYIESAAVGLMAGRMAAAEALEQSFDLPPVTTAFGALLHHITDGANADTYQPMNINFGLFPAPPLPEGVKKLKKPDRKKAMTNRAKADMLDWMNSQNLEKAA